MTRTVSRRTAIMAAGLSAAGAAGLAVPSRRAGAVAGDPLVIGRTNQAGRSRTLLRSWVGKDRAGGQRATLEVENLNQAGGGVGLFVRGNGNACITTYGQLGATGIRAVSNDGYAIEAQGRVSFDYSGSVGFKVGQSRRRVKLVSAQVVLPRNSFVLATLQGDGGTAVGVRYARRLPNDETGPLEVIEIALTSPAKRPVDVAFWVFEPPASRLLLPVG